MELKEAIEICEKEVTETYAERKAIAIQTILNELDNKDKEIEYWKEQAEGYQGLAEQIKEDFENRDRWE
jgi:dimeric dUTPase (all-alpha-NTP-PPase superfamily)